MHWQDKWTYAQPALKWLGAPPMEISMNLIQQLEKEQFDKLAATKVIPEFGPGDTVIVNVKVVEGERTQPVQRGLRERPSIHCADLAPV